MQAADRSNNITLFGLPEDASEDFNRTLATYCEEVGLKPAMKFSKFGKLKEKSTQPVKVTLSSSSTVYQRLSQARKLRQSTKFISGFVSPDRSLEDLI